MHSLFYCSTGSCREMSIGRNKNLLRVFSFHALSKGDCYPIGRGKRRRRSEREEKAIKQKRQKRKRVEIQISWLWWWGVRRLSRERTFFLFQHFNIQSQTDSSLRNRMMDASVMKIMRFRGDGEDSLCDWHINETLICEKCSSNWLKTEWEMGRKTEQQQLVPATAQQWWFMQKFHAYEYENREILGRQRQHSNTEREREESVCEKLIKTGNRLCGNYIHESEIENPRKSLSLRSTTAKFPPLSRLHYLASCKIE